MYLILIALIVCSALYLYTSNKRRRHGYTNTKPVPLVKTGYYPIIGNGIAFGKDIIGFVKRARQEYGDVFRLKIFRKDLIVVCDHNLKDEYFKAIESDMSLYDVLNQLFFGSAFSDDENNLPLIIKLVKSTIKINFDTFSTKIMDEANRMIERLKAKCENGPINVSKEMIRFVACTSARCFIGMELTDEFYDTLIEFAMELNKIVVLTYFLPKSILKLVFGSKLRKLRTRMIRMMDSEIESYRTNKTKSESYLFRSAVDYTDDELPNGLSNKQIGEIVVCLLYVSSENTALGLSSTVLDLVSNQEWWDKSSTATRTYLEDADVKSLFADQVLDAVIHESARMNTHIFPIGRKPKHPDATIGGFYVGDTDCIALCPPMLMLHDCSKNVNPSTFNPARFLQGVDADANAKAESKMPRDIVTWGAGSHLCPGKNFALYEIKAAVALITNHFEFPTIVKMDKTDYFSPSAYAERPAEIQMKALAKPTYEVDKSKYVQIVAGTKTFDVRYFAVNTDSAANDGADGGWLIRNYLSTSEQLDLYNYTVELSNNSAEQAVLEQARGSESVKPFYPLTFDNLVYTGESNCQPPSRWYKLVDELWDTMLENEEVLGFPITDPKVVTFKSNSAYAQLYSKDGSMKTHKDEYVDFGVSVSIGASTEFEFGPHTIILNTGDIFIADFSKVNHAVRRICDDLPGWFDESISDKVTTFGMHRFSIQIRNITVRPDKMLSMEEFKSML